ncbi:HNH endonuclease signature motif containing protein [uncultured Pseudacidovorax sp.]|uniref:HNH endonuclease signature motif containing protein n=1 Tax=uncultured Pseudacidovorax sp. TaxID=679313 RepID=UPI0025F19D03|nr:HNH endonuclease signature motif containing protein [uncultured Pseudacidovorax sp.]
MGIVKSSTSVKKNSLTSSAKIFTVVVQLTETIEYIPLSLQTLKAGDWLETVETFLDHTEPGTYDVECTGITRSRSDISVSLRYDPEARRNPNLAKEYPELEWGTMTLVISEDLTQISAIFKPEDGEPVEGRCTLLQPSLYANLTRGQVNLLLRPGQSALRQQLLRRYGECAITRERAPEALEAAHLIDHHAGGSAEIGNGILLRADLHGLFDCGKLQISNTGEVSLNELPPDSQYHSDLRERWNKKLPEDVFFTIRAALLERAKVRGAIC